MSQIIMVHLYWLDATKPSHKGDRPEGPEKHIFNTNAGNITLAKVCRNVALRSALGFIVISLFVGATIGFGTTSVV